MKIKSGGDFFKHFVPNLGVTLKGKKSSQVQHRTTTFQCELVDEFASHTSEWYKKTSLIDLCEMFYEHVTHIVNLTIFK